MKDHYSTYLCKPKPDPIQMFSTPDIKKRVRDIVKIDSEFWIAAQKQMHNHQLELLEERSLAEWKKNKKPSWLEGFIRWFTS